MKAVRLDLADGAALGAAVDEVALRHGRLDAVFANAGVSSGPGYGNPEGRMVATSRALWDRSLDVTLTGVFLTMQAAAPHLLKQRSGSIVVTASVAAVRPTSLPAAC